ncbi:acyl carrier protein [Streptomyces yunnanensis]|uniref:Acyl carrier protein n=1 Tax=Streptomyces yunnanensis TaxID=156453 RepID=A0A9X8N661_9ACTN|nr:acyl carrier protein [Streptomyces yunnanensis]SHN12914.1 acyl carrier protein [Streptomyces yunnanensis]
MINVRERLLEVLGAKFRIPADHVSDEATLKELDMDSLALVEFTLTVEEEYGATLDEDEVATLNVGQILARITEQVGEGAQ